MALLYGKTTKRWCVVMKKPELTKIETKYKGFDIASKIAACFFVILTIVFCVLLIIAKSDEIMVLFALLMVLDTVTIILFAAKINKNEMNICSYSKKREMQLYEKVFSKKYMMHTSTMVLSST